MNLQPISEIHGIQFFNRAHFCISHFEKTHWTAKAVSLIKSFGNLLSYSLHKMSMSFYRVDALMDPLTKPNRLSKKRLVVCIHGLNSNPTQFKKIIDAMEKKDLSQTDIFIPRVLLKGNAKLDTMVMPIFEEIAKWVQTVGEKELVLVGISNGGRICRAIEAKIAQADFQKNIKKIHFVSIVGACKGSILANLAHKLHLSWLMSKNIADEMPTNSRSNQQLNQEWIESLSKGPKREYSFIASPHDWQVTNYDSTLMDVNGQLARYAIVRGHGHNSIVIAVANSVAEIVLS